jgi:hypothetical protein
MEIELSKTDQSIRAKKKNIVFGNLLYQIICP